MQNQSADTVINKSSSGKQKKGLKKGVLVTRQKKRLGSRGKKKKRENDTDFAKKKKDGQKRRGGIRMCSSSLSWKTHGCCWCVRPPSPVGGAWSKRQRAQAAAWQINKARKKEKKKKTRTFRQRLFRSRLLIYAHGWDVPGEIETRDTLFYPRRVRDVCERGWSWQCEWGTFSSSLHLFENPPSPSLFHGLSVPVSYYCPRWLVLAWRLNDELRSWLWFLHTFFWSRPLSFLRWRLKQFISSWGHEKNCDVFIFRVTVR